MELPGGLAAIMGGGELIEIDAELFAGIGELFSDVAQSSDGLVGLGKLGVRGLGGETGGGSPEEERSGQCA